MLSASVFLLFLNLTFAASEVIVPSINIDYPFAKIFELKPLDGGYYLHVGNYDGILVQEVKEITPGELEVKGNYRQYLSNGLSLELAYDSGRNGYVAKWRIYQHMGGIAAGASAASLKSRVG